MSLSYLLLVQKVLDEPDTAYDWDPKSVVFNGALEVRGYRNLILFSRKQIKITETPQERRLDFTATRKHIHKP